MAPRRKKLNQSPEIRVGVGRRMDFKSESEVKRAGSRNEYPISDEVLLGIESRVSLADDTGADLSRSERMIDGQTLDEIRLNEYLDSVPNLRFREQVQLFKERLKRALRDFRQEIVGTKIEKSATQAALLIEKNLDKILLEILKIVDAKDNPDIIRRISNGKDIAIKKMGGILAFVTDGDAMALANHPTLTDSSRVDIFVNVSSLYEEKYSFISIMMVLIHEILHAWIGDDSIGGEVNYLTDFLYRLSQEAIVFRISADVVRSVFNIDADDPFINASSQRLHFGNNGLVPLIDALIELDRNVVMSWFAGGISTKEFRARLISAFVKKGRAQDEAENLVGRIFSIGKDLDGFRKKADEDFRKKMAVYREKVFPVMARAISEVFFTRGDPDGKKRAHQVLYSSEKVPFSEKILLGVVGGNFEKRNKVINIINNSSNFSMEYPRFEYSPIAYLKCKELVAEIRGQ